MSQHTLAFIAIGSNITPFEQIPQALDWLRHLPESSLFVESSWYRTLPWGMVEQPDFVNLVVGLKTCLSPHSLLGETRMIESRLQRVRREKNGPRTIDLDILLFGDRVLAEPDLHIPHPGLLVRDFMLIPLIEVAPDAVHPVRGRPVRTLTGQIRHRQILERLPGRGESAPFGSNP
jgi:2-amino-4-hydroxy-6-hydroxymethyldihydropteridine diphosphokinase|nr:2-amino-4-hydroxy-6-hydroxymethyldihydropteridine diphosphokinase [Thiocapsa sp.]